ncbi:hypothetical protein GCM10009720_09930 [Yaniella flava]|uniref:Uncharacterized protein n=1 Tax=Yaniella flava TaxID=287930 RepID=A0ABP5FT85_9MICC
MLGNQSVDTTAAKPGDFPEPQNAQSQLIDPSLPQTLSTYLIGGLRLSFQDGR